MLKPDNIPDHLRDELMSLAELVKQFGKADDGERYRALADASAAELLRLRTEVSKHQVALDEWLAGPEANGPAFSDEYVAFSAMRMAADMV